MHVPGGKDREDILCPYCNAQNGSVITDGWVRSYRIEEIKEKKEKLETDPIKNTVFHKRVRTKEEMEAIDAEVESKITDGVVKLALFGAATSEAIYNLLIDKGIITGEELSQAFYDSLETKIKNY